MEARLPPELGHVLGAVGTRRGQRCPLVVRGSRRTSGAEHGHARGRDPGGHGGGFSAPNQGTDAPTAAPPCPPRLGAPWGRFWGAGPTCRGLSSAATAAIYSGPRPPGTDTAPRSLTPKRGGLIWHRPRGRGSCPPGLSPAVAAGSGVVARGREQARASPRGAVVGTMRLCVPGTIGDGQPRHENKGLRDGMTRCRLALPPPPPGTAAPQPPGLPERDDAAGQPVPVPEALLHRVRAGTRRGRGGLSGICAFPLLGGGLRPSPRRGGCGRGQARMALAVSLLRAAFPMTPGPAARPGG